MILDSPVQVKVSGWKAAHVFNYIQLAFNGAVFPQAMITATATIPQQAKEEVATPEPVQDEPAVAAETCLWSSSNQ